MMEIKRNSSGHSSFKSIDSVIMKFPQFRDGLKEIRDVFERYGCYSFFSSFVAFRVLCLYLDQSLPLFICIEADEDSNGTIDNVELKKCLHTLAFVIRDEEIDDLFSYCDMDENEGIQFKEFIVLLCLIYLLTDFSTSTNGVYLYM